MKTYFSPALKTRVTAALGHVISSGFPLKTSLHNALASHTDRNAVRAATTLYSGVTVKMNFQAARFLTKLLLPLWLGFLTYLVIFLYLHFLAYAPFPQEPQFRELKNSLSFIIENEQPFSFKWRSNAACITFRDPGS